MTKNVFDFEVKRTAHFALNLDKVKEKLKGYSFDNLESVGYSLFIYYDGDEFVEGSYKIDDYREDKDVLNKDKWQKISKEFKIEKSISSVQIEKVLKFDFRLLFDYSSVEIQKQPYVVISKLYKYFKFINKDTATVENVFFNFTKNTTDYLVEVDEQSIDLTQFSYWTNLNFPGVLKTNLTNIAVSKLNNSYMMLDFRINAKEENFENLSICLKMKYYHDAHDALTTFLIETKPRGSKDHDEKTFNKLLEYNSFRQATYELVPKKNWLQLRVCFYKKFLKENVIYLESSLEAESQFGRYPSLTNAIGDFEIERGNERVISDFLYSWSTGFADPREDWYTTPILNNFRLKQDDDEQTYLELVNDQNAKVYVYHLISNAFELTSNMLLTFNLTTNHTDATLTVYLVEDTKRREILSTITLKKGNDRYQISIDPPTDANPESNAYFSATDMDEMVEHDKSEAEKANKNEPKVNDKADENDRDERKDEEKKNSDEDLVANAKSDDNQQPQDEDRSKEQAKDSAAEKKFAKLIFEFKFKRHLEENESSEKLKLFNLNLMDPCDQRKTQCNYGKCISQSSDQWHCKCEGRSPTTTFFNRTRSKSFFHFF